MPAPPSSPRPPPPPLHTRARAPAGGAPGQALAREMADRFLGTAYAAYNQTGNMFEKFNATGARAEGCAGRGVRAVPPAAARAQQPQSPGHARVLPPPLHARAVVGLPGGGGEYEVLAGFGWTNGARCERTGWLRLRGVEGRRCQRDVAPPPPPTHTTFASAHTHSLDLLERFKT